VTRIIPIVHCGRAGGEGRVENKAKRQCGLVLEKIRLSEKRAK